MSSSEKDSKSVHKHQEAQSPKSGIFNQRKLDIGRILGVHQGKTTESNANAEPTHASKNKQKPS